MGMCLDEKFGGAADDKVWQHKPLWLSRKSGPVIVTAVDTDYHTAEHSSRL